MVLSRAGRETAGCPSFFQSLACSPASGQSDSCPPTSSSHSALFSSTFLLPGVSFVVLFTGMMPLYPLTGPRVFREPLPPAAKLQVSSECSSLHKPGLWVGKCGQGSAACAKLGVLRQDECVKHGQHLVPSWEQKLEFEHFRCDLTQT